MNRLLKVLFLMVAMSATASSFGAHFGGASSGDREEKGSAKQSVSSEDVALAQALYQSAAESFDGHKNSREATERGQVVREKWENYEAVKGQFRRQG